MFVCNRLALKPGGCIELHTRPSLGLRLLSLRVTSACHAFCCNKSKVTLTAVSSRVTQSLFINVLRCPVRPSVRTFRMLRCQRNHQRKGCTTCCLFLLRRMESNHRSSQAFNPCRIAPCIPAFSASLFPTGSGVSAYIPLCPRSFPFAIMWNRGAPLS